LRSDLPQVGDRIALRHAEARRQIDRGRIELLEMGQRLPGSSAAMMVAMVESWTNWPFDARM
jgi:hypothetical protein